MNQFNFNHFYYFYIIVKLDGVTSAARYLNTSQSSLSIQLKNLELLLEDKLFQKTGRKIELTHFGKEIFQYCRRSFENFEMLSNRLKRQSQSTGFRLSLGVAYDIDRPFVTDVLAKVIKQYHPNERPTLNLVSLPAQQLMQSLKTGEIDLLLTVNALIDQNIEIIQAFSLPIGIFGSNYFYKEFKDIEFDKKTRINSLPFIFPLGTTSLRSELDNFLIKKKLSPRCTFESNIISSLIRAAVDGLGILAIPRVYVKRELNSNKLFALNKKILWRHRLLLLSGKTFKDEEKSIFAEKLAQQFLNEMN